MLGILLGNEKFNSYHFESVICTRHCTKRLALFINAFISCINQKKNGFSHQEVLFFQPLKLGVASRLGLMCFVLFFNWSTDALQAVLVSAAQESESAPRETS